MDSKSDDSWFCSLAGQDVGKYNLKKFIGKGQIGYVYRAEHRDLPGVERAVKLIFDSLKDGWEVELKKVAKLNLVPNVVKFYEIDTAQPTHDGKTHLCQVTVWDYIPPGENLRAYLNRMNEVGVGTSFLIAVLECILHVLNACHEKGVSRHGDLHSGNILIGTDSTLDYSLQRRDPIYVSDFGYGATGGKKLPKDDYKGLAQITNEIIAQINYSTSTPTDRQVLHAIKNDVGKLLNESSATERRKPIEILRTLNDIKKLTQGWQNGTSEVSNSESSLEHQSPKGISSVGQFQVSEMIGNRWDLWQRLFVPKVPARSKILVLDIPTVVTGPRGCGKTMLFRRLSERLEIECGEVSDLPVRDKVFALYVNANDFADAFSHFPQEPVEDDEKRLICYANLCVLADFLAVESARVRKMPYQTPDDLILTVRDWLIPKDYFTILEGEDRLERCRTILEQIKWKFSGQADESLFPGFDQLSNYRWLPSFAQKISNSCAWIEKRVMLLFIDDFSLPRISSSMQRILNRLFLQRSPEFLAKVATEATSTFITEDSSGKTLQDGDDFQLVDMGEESLFLRDNERLEFLNEVFTRRLKLDPRIPEGSNSLKELLGIMPLSKTEFARRLRGLENQDEQAKRPDVEPDSQRRGRTRPRVHYFGENVFSDLWSGDTRTMIQLITDIVDDASGVTQPIGGLDTIDIPINEEAQDRIFRRRGGEWLNSHTRNEPTDPATMKNELSKLQKINPDFKLFGEYGDHLKAVVEAFYDSAKKLLLGPTYKIKKGNKIREVPRMAFRIEIIDEFRIDGLGREIYRDLIRYGLFMRDDRGKSVRSTFVPRLYLRRLLLPYCALPLSKRDSVMLTCNEFLELLLEPDNFKKKFLVPKTQIYESTDQMNLYPEMIDGPDPDYDDISEEELDS